VRIDVELKKRVQLYCARNNTNMTDVVTRFFVRLLESDAQKKRQVEDAEQI